MSAATELKTIEKAVRRFTYEKVLKRASHCPSKSILCQLLGYYPNGGIGLHVYRPNQLNNKYYEIHKAAFLVILITTFTFKTKT